MNCEFIRKITRRPVLDAAGRLSPDITRIIAQLKTAGKDPIKELTNCRDYLDQSIVYMTRNPDLFCKWQLYSKKKFRRGTKASLEYMRKSVCEIIAVLSVEKFNTMMKL